MSISTMHTADRDMAAADAIHREQEREITLR